MLDFYNFLKTYTCAYYICMYKNWYTKHLSPKNSILIYGTYKVNLDHVYKYMCIIVYLLLQQFVTPKLWSKNTTL